MRMYFKFKLAAAVSAVLVLTGVSAVNAANFTLSKKQPTVVTDLAGQSNGYYIVRLKDQPMATYNGGIKGLSATSAKATDQKRLNTKSPAAKAYLLHLKSEQSKLLNKASTSFGRTLKTKFDYQHAVNGFAVGLTVDEAKALRNMEGVVSVKRERMEYLLTDVGPQWIDAPAIWNASVPPTLQPNGSKGENLVVAVFDSGINSDHPSFAAVGGDGYVHTNPLGSGNYLPGSYCATVDPDFCNDKLIGAWDFTDIDGTIPEDDDGHGSHTAGTAAGNVVIGAELATPTTSASFNISGVAPHANIIAYDVCQETCPGSALIAAVEQVVIDSSNLPNGVAALNYSISGGGDPYNDDVELGFLAAVEAGIYVAASAGNSGPTASTVAHLGPWVATTAASTHNRLISNGLVNINGDGASLVDMNGSSFSAGYGPAPIIHANTIASDPDGQCLTPFPAGTFNGEIVMCDRGEIARTEKGENVLAGGAGGYVLGNLGQGESTVADAHFLPAIHLGDTNASELKAWLATNTGTTATITPYGFDFSASNGDIMAGFSSRGPQLAFDVMKPDVTAPGVDIMAAEADGQSLQAPEYQIISGTSMSSPHNAGAGVLMTAMKPNLTPTEIKSVLMMSGVNQNTLKEDGVTPTDPFDLGAGRLDLGAAIKTDLVLSETSTNFLAADPNLGGDPSTLNIPSMMDSNCIGTCSWTRTITRKSNQPAFHGLWFISLSPSNFEAELAIGAGAFSVVSDDKQSAVVRLNDGESAAITVTAENYASDEGWEFGQLNLKRWGRESPDLSMPMAVFASTSSNANLFNKTVDADFLAHLDTLTYSIDVTNGPLSGPITVIDQLPIGTTFIAGSANETVTNGSTTSPWAYDAASNSMTWTGELDPNGIDVSADGNITDYISLASLGVAPIELPADCDDGSLALTVPPFTFNGESYSEVIFSVNGTVEAGTDSGVATSFDNQNFPNAIVPNNLLAPFWRDLNACDGGNLYAGNLGDGTYTWTVFEWEDVPHFGSTDAATFQVWILNDGSPTDLPQAHFTYGRLDNVTVGATVGAENSDGSVGDSYFFNGSGVAPTVGTDLWVNSLPGGTASFDFQVQASCRRLNKRILNEANITNNISNETAIAVSYCTPFIIQPPSF